MPSSFGLDVTFSDRSNQAGVGRSTESYGASVADTNGDGYPDIYVSNHRERPSLYVNQRNGAFVDAAPSVQTWVQRPGADTHGGGFADVDNDGDPDLLITTGRGNDQQFFINQAGTLVDRTTAWTVGSPLVGGRLAVWYDYNGDRLLDMSVPQYGGVSPMYTNRGDRFSEDTSMLSSVCVRHMYAQLLDVSGDGVLDFICSGEQTFPQAVFDMTTVPWQRITAQFPVVDHVVDSVLGDFNNDGRMDMFLLSNQQTRPSSAAQHGARQVEFRTQGGLKAISFVSDGDITIDLDWNLFKRSDFANFIFIGANGRHPTGFPLTLSAPLTDLYWKEVLPYCQIA